MLAIRSPIAKIAIWVLIETNDVCAAAIDRKIARSECTEIPNTAGRPAEEILRPVISAPIHVGAESHYLVHLVLGSSLYIIVASTSRPRKVEWRCRIKSNRCIVGTSVIREPSIRAQAHCPAVCTAYVDVRRQRTRWQASVGRTVVACACVC